MRTLNIKLQVLECAENFDRDSEKIFYTAVKIQQHRKRENLVSKARDNPFKSILINHKLRGFLKITSREYKFGQNREI